MWISGTGFHPNHRINVNSANRNLFNPRRKVWLLLRGFSRNSPSLNTFLLVSVPIFFFKSDEQKIRANVIDVIK